MKTEFLSTASNASDMMEFKKTNEAIGLRIQEGKLSLLSRKLFNVLVYHAQQLQEPGLNAPIDTPAAKKYFWIPLSEVARDAAYDSNDTALLKHHLDEFQNIKIHIEDDHQWTSERLISSVKLVNPNGLKKRGGVVWIGFAFPPEVFELVMNPAIYTKLSIQYQSFLRSGPSLALYEICRRYATNPSRVTAIHSFGHWVSALTGNPFREVPPPYKYFKRDVLTPSITEINTATDIDVELIEHKVRRRVEQLQFSVQLKKQSRLGRLNFPSAPVIDSDLLEKIMRYGFSQAEASNFLAEHGDEKIRSIIQMVDTRISSKKSPPLDSPAAYFRWALRQNGSAQLSIAKSTTTKSTPKKKETTLRDKFLAVRSADALERFKALPQAEQSRIIDLIKQSPEFRNLKFGRGLQSPIVRSVVAHWYAKELWGGEPSDEDLLRFAETLITESP